MHSFYGATTCNRHIQYQYVKILCHCMQNTLYSKKRNIKKYECICQWIVLLVLIPIFLCYLGIKMQDCWACKYIVYTHTHTLLYAFSRTTTIRFTVYLNLKHVGSILWNLPLPLLKVVILCSMTSLQLSN